LQLSAIALQSKAGSEMGLGPARLAENVPKKAAESAQNQPFQISLKNMLQPIQDSITFTVPFLRRRKR
jgi:hypothetical protein